MLIPFTTQSASSSSSSSVHPSPPAYEQCGASSGCAPKPKNSTLTPPGKDQTQPRGMYAVPRDRSVAKTRSGSFGFGKQAVELSINVADNLVFLYPNSEEEEGYVDGETPESRPRATFVVSIILSIAEGSPRPPPIESLTVQLRGLETLGFPQGGLEQNIILYATKKVQEAQNLELLPGSAYRWEVPIELSHDVAPYERMRYGRVFQKMSVHLKWSTKTIFFSKYKDLSVERDVWLTCIPRTSNILDYARTHRTENEQLGSLTMHVRSHHLTVGSYLRFGLHLPQRIEKNCKILKVQLTILQFTALYSRKRSGVVMQDNRPERIPFLTIEDDEFNDRMDNLQGNWIARIPTCFKMRPSTLKGSRGAAIRVSHKFEVQIHFTPQGHEIKEKPLIYSAQWPVEISSCTCRWRSLKLPSYSKVDPTPLPYGLHEMESIDYPSGSTYRGRLQSHLDQTDCSCGISMEEILKFEQEYDQAQHISLTDLMSQDMLADAATQPPAWQEDHSDPISDDSSPFSEQQQQQQE